MAFTIRAGAKPFDFIVKAGMLFLKICKTSVTEGKLDVQAGFLIIEFNPALEAI